MLIKRPYTLWLLGPTSSGKTTIAKHFVHIMRDEGFSILHYDGDEVRDFFGKDFGFSESSRGRVVKVLAFLAKKANDANLNVIISALTAHQSSRDFIKNLIPNLLIGYIDCPIKICAERDPKGLYKKAQNGEIDTLIGYNSEYLVPDNPDIRLNSNKNSVSENTKQLTEFLGIYGS